ncbi:hypothetical protein IFM47457_06314 [Aspergillus lentulus]|nr:hypothetical protein IFM47457_06314 [Aspergillus lentulus]
MDGQAITCRKDSIACTEVELEEKFPSSAGSPKEILRRSGPSRKTVLNSTRTKVAWHKATGFYVSEAYGGRD